MLTPLSSLIWSQDKEITHLKRRERFVVSFPSSFRLSRYWRSFRWLKTQVHKEATNVQGEKLPLPLWINPRVVPSLLMSLVQLLISSKSKTLREQTYRNTLSINFQQARSNLELCHRTKISWTFWIILKRKWRKWHVFFFFFSFFFFFKLTLEPLLPLVLFRIFIPRDSGGTGMFISFSFFFF